MNDLSDIWSAVFLTLKLALVSTFSLVIIATPVSWWLACSKKAWKEAVAAILALPVVLPPTVIGFYLLIALGPKGPGGLIARLYGNESLAFSFTGLVIGSIIYSLPFVVQPIRNSCSHHRKNTVFKMQSVAFCKMQLLAFCYAKPELPET